MVIVVRCRTCAAAFVGSCLLVCVGVGVFVFDVVYSCCM